MSQGRKYTRWSVNPKDLLDVTPTKARDIIIECFFEAQKEIMAQASQMVGRTQDETQLLETVKTIVKVAFRETSGDFDRPTKEDLVRVVESLSKKSAAWGTPDSIRDHHKKQIEKVLERL